MDSRESGFESAVKVRPDLSVTAHYATLFGDAGTMTETKLIATSVSEAPTLLILSQLDTLKNAWQQEHPDRAEGGLLALSGFEHQFLLTLLKIVYLWKSSTEAERQESNTAQTILAEAISDITESGIDITLTQVKRTLSATAIRKALDELWEVFNLASERTPDLVKYLRFIISGKFKEHENPEQVIQGWGSRSKIHPEQTLRLFKESVRCELVCDPRADLSNELQAISRDEDTETTIARWLGYLLQLGSGFSPENISTFIWQELNHDRSLEAFRATLARLFSRSHNRLSAIRDTLGKHITLPRLKLSDLQAAILEKQITLLLGASGSGKSALCKVGIQQHFKQQFTCLFLDPSDIASFTESSDVIASRGTRRLDELLISRIIHKPVLIVIDDLSDADDRDFDAVLNLLHTTLSTNTSVDVRFILVAHTDAMCRIHEKISARFSSDFSCAKVELPQLPITELQSSQDLPNSIISLIRRYREFGPALNLKLIDWLVRSAQKNPIDVSGFKNDLDLLSWFWCHHIQNGQKFSDSGQVLIKIADRLAERFTPDLPCIDLQIDNDTLRTLVRRDCLRIMDERLAVTHRFVGDCARFYYLRGNCRDIESGHLVEWLKNPFWVQPIRWFALQLAMESAESETWQELICEALEGEHLQLLDLLLDGAILSKQPDVVLQGCPDRSLPLIIARLIARLLAIATDPHPFHIDVLQSTSLQEHIAIQERITGIPKVDLWEPVWRWLLARNPEIVIEESCIFFKAAEAWLNWSVYVVEFPLRVEVANFTLNLAQAVLLPDREEQVISNSEITTLIERRQQQEVATQSVSNIRKRPYLGDFESNALSCIVFALKIIPDRSAWLLKAFAGREIIPANKLEPTKISLSVISPGVGVLETPHQRGPLGKVNYRFRKFMLRQGGSYLDCVMRVNPSLGAELLLALTIAVPDYQYEDDDNDFLNDDWGTSGSHEINVCTFDFRPLLTLLKNNESVGIEVVAIISTVVTDYWHKHRWLNGNLEGSLATDTNGVTLIIDGTKKIFTGGRQALCWHRKYPFCPKILACLLMTLEGWLYSRPTRSALERSISLIFKYSDTVAMLGILLSLAKCELKLLSNLLLPLVSSIQLLVWLEFEQIDRCQDYSFDTIGARKLSEDERQNLFNFQILPHRRILLSEVIPEFWLNEIVVNFPQIASQILVDWDEYQLNLVPDTSQYRALIIRSTFDRNNWKLIECGEGNYAIQFVAELPNNPEYDAAKISARIQYSSSIMNCRKILDGEQKKTLEIHDELISLLQREERISFLQADLEPQEFNAVIWSAIAIILEPPFNSPSQELQNNLNYLAQDLINFPIALDYSSRCQCFNLDASAFIAHVAPRLLKSLQSDRLLRAAAFRCLIGTRDIDTSAFMRSWIAEYGIESPLTQQLINIAPQIARLLSLTHKLAYAKLIQKATGTDGCYLVPRPEEVDYEVCKREDSLIEAAWLSLQNDFAENKLQQLTIVETLDWIPEVLIQPIQEHPDWMQNKFTHVFNWEFLAASLTSILESKMESNGEETRQFISQLCHQYLFALIQKRESIYIKNQIDRASEIYGNAQTNLYESQTKILDAIVLLDRQNFSIPVGQMLCILKDFDLIDCTLLGDIVDTLHYYFISNNIMEVADIRSKSQIAFAIGSYLFEFRNKLDCDLRIIGQFHDIWEKLIRLLAQGSNIEDKDRSLVEFLEHFQEVLLAHGYLREKLYDIGKLSGCCKLRRIIFKEIVRQQEFLPTSRNDESEVLVRVIAELWDSDKTWILSKTSRCQDLRTLLGQLQKIDAIGARTLADRVADSLA